MDFFGSGGKGADRWRKSGLIGPIDSREEAERVAKECAKGFFVLAAIEAFIGIWLFPSAVLDAVLYVIFGFWLYKKQSRIAAVILMVLSIVAVCVTLRNKFAPRPNSGGSNIILAVIMVWYSIRAVKSSFKFHQTVPADSFEPR